MCTNNANYLPRRLFPFDCNLKITWAKLTMTTTCGDQNGVFAKNLLFFMRSATFTIFSQQIISGKLLLVLI